MDTATLAEAETALNLARLKSPVRARTKESPLGLPAGFASADLLVFARRPGVALCAEVGPWARTRAGGVVPANPVVDAFLLTLFPLRGPEVTERPIEVLCMRKDEDEGKLRV